MESGATRRWFPRVTEHGYARHRRVCRLRPHPDRFVDESMKKKLRDRMRDIEQGTGGPAMNRSVFLLALLGSVLALSVWMPTVARDYGLAKVNPLSLAEQDLAAETRGDVAAAPALY